MVTKVCRNEPGIYGKVCRVHIYTHVVNLKHKIEMMQRVYMYAVARLGARIVNAIITLKRSSIDPILVSANMVNMLEDCPFN